MRNNKRTHERSSSIKSQTGWRKKMEKMVSIFNFNIEDRIYVATHTTEEKLLYGLSFDYNKDVLKAVIENEFSTTQSKERAIKSLKNDLVNVLLSQSLNKDNNETLVKKENSKEYYNLENGKFILDSSIRVRLRYLESDFLSDDLRKEIIKSENSEKRIFNKIFLLGNKEEIIISIKHKNANDVFVNRVLYRSKFKNDNEIKFAILENSNISLTTLKNMYKREKQKENRNEELLNKISERIIIK